MGEGGTKAVGVMLAVPVGGAVDVADAKGAGVVAVAGTVGAEVGVIVAFCGARRSAIHPMQ